MPQEQVKSEPTVDELAVNVNTGLIYGGGESLSFLVFPEDEATPSWKDCFPAQTAGAPHDDDDDDDV